ncbi:adenine nucleotide alpha hydrolase family protein [Ferruginibacter sp.]|nr:universal stress protein [Ferruginibacter sp.]
MKKIIAAFDGLKFSQSTLDYSINMAKQTNAYLAGVFLDDFTYTSYKIYDLVGKEGVTEQQLKDYTEKDKARRDKSTFNFEKSCKKAGLNFGIHHDRNIAIKELLHESIYADLMIIDRKETLTHYPEKIPTRFIRDLLADVQCPVLLVPQNYKPLDKIVILFDGEPSSVHALKMFGYMFPMLKHLPAEVISVKNMNSDLHVPDFKLMKEYIKLHYPKVVFTVLKGLAETEIVTHLKNEKHNCIIVTGAYRRGMVSRWFRASMADALMKEIKLPLFIAHNK